MSRKPIWLEDDEVEMLLGVVGSELAEDIPNYQRDFLDKLYDQLYTLAFMKGDSNE